MEQDSYCLRLIDRRIADAIRRSSARQRRLFAVRCAIEAMNHLRSVEGDAAAEALRELLTERLFSDTSEDDHVQCVPLLSEVEDQLYERLVALRSVHSDMDVQYQRYVAVANVWHAVRAQKFAMMSESIVAAGMAAFEASFVVPDAEALFLLSREMLVGEGAA